MSFGLDKMVGMRIVSFFHDHRLPNTCMGLICSTLSSSTRYYIFSSMPIPTYGYSVCENDGEFMWYGDDPTYLMDEDEARARQREMVSSILYCGNDKASSNAGDYDVRGRRP